MTISVVISVNTVGSKKVPPLRGPLAAGADFGTLLQGVGDVCLDLRDRLHVDQRPDHGTRLERVGDLHRTCALAERLAKASRRCPAPG
jgi:hypothetical protein